MNRHAPTITILHGHVLDKLKELPNGSVHCIVTSPNYWGLRDYSRCECVTPSKPNPSCPKCHGTGKDESLEVMWPDGWHGQLGLEPTPELYVKHIVQVFRELWRVLRDDGTLWLNMGDCYASSGEKYHGGWNGDSYDGGNNPQRLVGEHLGGKTAVSGLKPKDLVGMPWRIAIALQADGWYLRSDIIWSKPNPMPESVTDRPTKSHDYVFLLSKSAQYFYDADAVREDWSMSTLERARYPYANTERNPDYQSKHLEGDFRRFPIAGSLITPKGAQRELDHLRTPERMGHGPGWRERTDRIAGRNLRTVWTIPTQPYPDAHFATFPEKLVEPCIKAGCPKDGTVLDPFAGSGTVGAVARSLGRSAILIEIKEQYIELIKERTDYAHKALDSFIEPA